VTNTGNLWWDTQHQLPAGAKVVPGICACDETHTINFSGVQHTSSHYIKNSNIRNEIRCTPTIHTWKLAELICCILQGAKINEEAWHTTIATALSTLRNLDISSAGSKWYCVDQIQRQCYPLFAAWVGDYPKPVMVAQVSYHSCLMCEIPKGAPMRYLTFRSLDHSEDWHVYTTFLKETRIDALHTHGVHPTCNQFWHYPLYDVYQLWLPDELHQLLLSQVQDLLHFLHKFLEVKNIKDQFDNQFTFVP